MGLARHPIDVPRVSNGTGARATAALPTRQPACTASAVISRDQSSSTFPRSWWKNVIVPGSSLTSTRSLTPCQRAASAADSTRSAVNR